jgi:hypothetical protein
MVAAIISCTAGRNISRTASNWRPVKIFMDADFYQVRLLHNSGNFAEFPGRFLARDAN